jgi:hypothetical protein
MIGAPVDDTAVDRILATIDLAGTTAILSPGVEAEKLDAATATEFKRTRWGGAVRSMLGFLTALIRRRALSTSQARKKIAGLIDALSDPKVIKLGNDPANEAALALAEMALGRLHENMVDARAWTNERIAGEFLPRQYWTFTKRPTPLRKSKKQPSGSEAVRFVQAVMRELGISYSAESIIRAMKDASKPKRFR